MSTVWSFIKQSHTAAKNARSGMREARCYGRDFNGVNKMAPTALALSYSAGFRIYTSRLAFPSEKGCPGEECLGNTRMIK